MNIYKKIMSGFLVVLLTFGSIITVGAEALPVYGDVYADGSITVVDATEISKHLAELSTLTDEQLTKADFNGDGKVNIADSTDIQKMIANLDYKYTHELYEVEYASFSSDGLTEVPFTVDKDIHAGLYQDTAGDYYYYNKEIKMNNLFKTYDEYSRFFDATFDEYNEEFFEENALIFLSRFYVVMSIYITLDNVYVKDNVLYLNITQWESTDWMLEANAQWNQFIVVDKEEIASVDKICVNTNYEYYSFM